MVQAYNQVHIRVQFFAIRRVNRDLFHGGLTPSIGTGLVECFSDSDRNGVFKITDKDRQFVTIVQTDASGNENWQNFNLRGLTLEAAT